jgi:HEPN domain-containing protein
MQGKLTEKNARCYRITREGLINDFAIRSFRDTADEDYVAARTSFRTGLFGPAHWQTQQAVEKYLKCTLLLYRIPANDINHDIRKALNRLKSSGKLDIDLCRRSLNFLDEIQETYRFRYFDVSIVGRTGGFMQLDRLVWELRRYCTLDTALHALKLEHGKIAPRYSLPGGRLEEIISSKDNLARPALLWQNGFFGVRMRRKVRYREIIHCRNAPLYMHPELLDDLLPFVHISRELLYQWRAHGAPDHYVPPDPA